MAIKGMDISYWQGNVDFARVAADGIKFAILREGYAQTVDAKFRQYVDGCRKNGIEIKGVYHFSYALNAEQAAQEAAFCIKQMEQAGLGKDVIVFYDFEYDTVKKAKAKGVTLGKNECIAFTKAFCEYVESHGYKAGVYSNIDYHRNMYSDEVLSKYVYWLADYTGSPDYDCAFHQYTSSGTVSGIDGKVDMDYYYGEETKENQGEKKSVTEVAKEVLAGDWGNGDDRKNRLAAAGYDYATVQAEVNRLAGATSAPKKSVAEIAKEVIAGQWGNGDDRKNRLKKAGKKAGMVSMEVRYYDFRNMSHQVQLQKPTNDPVILCETACNLFRESWSGEPVRLLGIRTSKLVEENAPEQLTIFDIEFPKEPDEKHKKLNAALEQLNNRYGKGAVVKGTFYKPDGKKKKDGI